MTSRCIRDQSLSCRLWSTHSKILLQIRSSRLLNITKSMNSTNNGLTEDGTCVILPWLNTDPLSLHDIQSFEYRVKHHDLSITLSDLSLPIVHVRPSKRIYLAIINTRSMSAPPENPLHRINRAISYISPLRQRILIVHRLRRRAQFRHFLNRIIILPSNQIRLLVTISQRRILPRRRHPILLRHLGKLGIERFPLLHSLDEML